MTDTTAIDVRRVTRIGHAEAMRVTATENDRLADQLATFTPDDWGRPTVCTRWSVRDVVAHLVGAAAAQASIREFARQVRAGRPLVAEIGAEYWWDGMNEVQVRERAGVAVEALRAEWAAVAPKALKARTRMPRPVARLPLLGLPDPVGRQPLAYLFDIGFTRDVWMHRVDLADATGRHLVADAAHDGRILADIVAEWAGTHGEPFTLELTGAAGGAFVSGSGGETVRLDAVEFARILSGRRPGEGLLRHPLPL